LSEKGYRVAVLEQGRRITNQDMKKAQSPLNLFWMPALGLKGFFRQSIFRNVGIVGGVGVGGGSLVYAAVLIKPEKELFKRGEWCETDIDWAGELEPHYQNAMRIFDRQDYPYFGQMDGHLKKTAETMGVGNTFGRVPLGMYFGEPDISVEDPYFEGSGPKRTGCIQCGECLTGCPYDAKNSLDQNYLYLAESLGAEILPQHRVTLIRPLGEGGYELEMDNPIKPGQKYAPLRARKVVLAAGVLGSLTLLFRCRDVFKTLPQISSRLGETVRTNSEAIVGILSKEEDIDLIDGPTISTDFYPNSHTHITQNRFPKGYTFMKWYMGPFVDDANPLRRALKTVLAFIRHPMKSTASWRASRWHHRINILTVMQHIDNQVSFQYGRSLFSLFSKGLHSHTISGKSAPAYLPIANQAAQIFARHADGTPLNVLLETLFNMSITAHILGGCQIGPDRESGVIDTNHQVFGCPDLFVVDGSAIPANLGVNPALTITALAERCMSLIQEDHKE